MANVKLILKECSAVASTVPVTASLIFAAGEFRDVSILNGTTKIPRQLDIRSRHADGSINHALCSFPFLTSGQKDKTHTLVVSPEVGQNLHGMPIPNIDLDSLAVKLTLRDSGGKTWIAQVPKELGWDIVRVAITTTALSPAILGPYAREIEYPLELRSLAEKHPNLYIIARWRLYQNGPARVELVVENSSYPKMADIEVASLSVEIGEANRNIDVPDGIFYAGQRFRLTQWLGSEPSIIVRQDPGYLRKIGVIPTLNIEQPLSEDEVRKTLSGYLEFINVWGQDGTPLVSTPILRKMGTTGDRDDIGPFPEWGRCAINSLEPTAQALLLAADTNGAGSFPVHLRDSNRNMGLTRDKQITHAKGGAKCPNEPDRAHHPCLAYISYLLTGDRYYEEELCAWASYCTRDWPWGVELRYPGGRDSAWSLRTITYAARSLPDQNPLKSYFLHTVQENLKIWTNDYIVQGTQWPLHTWKDGEWHQSGRPNWPCAKYFSPWQFAWHVWSLYNTWKVLASEDARKLFVWSCHYFQEAYVRQIDAEFIASNGEVIRWNPLYTDQYSLPISVYTPMIDSKGKWSEAPNSVRMISNLAESLWYLHVNESNKWTAGQYPAFPAEGPEPQNWLPKPADYREPQSTFEEYAMGPLAPAMVIAGIPDAERIWAFIKPFVEDKNPIPGLRYVPTV
jgi:hypothetical protein